MMLSNESVLLYLYESMFPSEKAKKPSSAFKRMEILGRPIQPPETAPNTRLAMTTAGNWKKHYF